jgi:hypothetical protein
MIIKIQNKKVIILIFILFIVIIFLLSFLYYKNQKNKQIPAIFIQKSVNKIKLPYNCSMNIPTGFSVFESKTKNMISYNFIKYIPEWKNNNFVKIDLTIINKKYLDISSDRFGESNFDFDEAIIKPKLDFSNELKNLREKSREEGQLYDVDYGQFKPQYAINGKINDKIWRRYALQLYEIQDDKKTSIIKIWNNLYTIYKDYVFVFDYICDAGIKTNNSKSIEGYSESSNGIDKLTHHLISSIEFK